MANTTAVCLTIITRPWGTAVQGVYLAETSNASSHLRETGRRGSRSVCPVALQTTPPAARSMAREPTWQAEAPITSVRGPHTHTRALLGTGPWREQAGTTQWNVYPPVCLSSQHPFLTPGKIRAGSPGEAEPLQAPHPPSTWLSPCPSNK